MIENIEDKRLTTGDSAMTVSFIWDHQTPKRPHGDDVVVVFDTDEKTIVDATYVHNSRPLPRGSRRLLDAHLMEKMERVGGWERFKRGYVRVLGV